GGVAAPDHQATWLIQLGVKPRKERRQRARVENPLSLGPIDGGRSSRKKAVEHPEGAGLQPGERGTCSGFDFGGALVEARTRRRGEGHIDGDVKRLLLTGC